MTKEWGNACWDLFHATAVNLNEKETHLIPYILGMINNVCNNLPCPICSDHAINTLKRLKRERIKTKEELIKCIWQFHNFVNERTNKPFYSREKHDSLYKNKSIDNIVTKWVTIMSRSWGGTTNLMFSFSRRNVAKKVVEFYKKHNKSFMRY